jgi:prepilin-type N-terminal cleavage/methylation domain-containing protein
LEFTVENPGIETVSKKKNGYEAGLTLIELSIVLLIVALLYSFAIPKIYIITEVNLRTSARKLAETIRLVQSFSVTQTRQYMVQYDMDKGTYAYAQGTEDVLGKWHYVFQENTKESKEASSFLSKTFPLGQGVFFQDIYDLVKGEKYDKGEIRTEFSPRGITTPLLIHLGDNKSRFYTLLVDRYGGKVTLRKGNLTYSDLFSEESK